MIDKKDQQLASGGLGRRSFINTAALVGLTAGVAACTEKPGTAAAPAAPAAPASSHAGAGANVHLKPGELDTYYGLWSGGHTGDMRVLGLPSGREITRIPCFVPDALVGWGITNESKAVMGTKPDGSLKYTVADTHHTHASYKDGNYDGRYAWINDKINSRIARIRPDLLHLRQDHRAAQRAGLPRHFPTRRDPVDPASTTPRACSAAVSSASRCPTPAPKIAPKVPLDVHLRGRRNHGSALAGADRRQLRPDRHLVRRQARCHQPVQRGNGRQVRDMMSAERDACLFFNIARIEEAVKAGKFKTIGTSKVPVVDGTHEANKDPRRPSPPMCRCPRTRTA